jgi:hypothetical protein
LGVGSESRRALVAAVAAALLAGCGGSVADADTRGVTPRTTSRAASAQAAPFCAAVQANADAIRPLNNLRLGSPVAADQLTATVEAARLSGAALRGAAPDALRGDVQRTVDALDVELDALLAAGGDPDVAARNPQVVAQYTSPEVAAAGRRVAAYVSQNCGQASR